MSNPIICNRSPAPSAIGGVDSGARFSLRVVDRVVDRSKVFFHLGAGPAFYPGGIHPQDHETVNFTLATKFFNFHDPADVSVDGGTDELIIDKTLTTQVQAATFFFGGLQSPAIPEAPLMLEFTLSLQDADVSNITINASDDQHQLAGPECGFFIGDTGVVVRFMRDSAGPGGARWVELHDVRLTAPGYFPPIAVSQILHDWDQGQAWTYKVLWHPQLDVLRLYVSTGPLELLSDLLLVDARVSDVTPIPAAELRPNLPLAFFGHGHGDPISTSRWGNAYLYNLVHSPIVEGIFPGLHTGTIQSDDVVHYRGDARPRQVLQPWIIIPDSLGPVSGNETLNGDRLVLSRAGSGTSYGYYRVEPTLDSEPVVFDFKLTGLYQNFDDASANTGMEVFIDDGTKVLRFCLLYSGATQYVGILVDDTNPESLVAYNAVIYGWSGETSYRIIYAPGLWVKVVQLVVDEGELKEFLLTQATYESLPDTRDPSGAYTPSLGFLLNGADSVEYNTSMQLGRIRYSANARLLDGTTTPPSPWTGEGMFGDPDIDDSSYAVATSDGVELHLDDQYNEQGLYFWRHEAMLSAIIGVTVEFKVRVDSYKNWKPQPLLATYDWNGSSTVATADTSEVTVGAYIRLDADGRWYRVNTVYTNMSVELDGSSWPVGTTPSSFSPELELNPIRTTTGVGLSIDDAVFQTMLIFAQEGPTLGKIMFLATMENLDDNLLAIRAGDPSVEGTYAPVDWTVSRIYRIERTNGVGLKVFVDDSDTSLIDFGYGDFQPPPTLEGVPMVRFGNMIPERLNSSYWSHVRYSVSAGIDVAAFPVLSQNEVLARFDHAVNVIAEAEDNFKTEFFGSAAEFDTTLDPIEDFEDEWPDVGSITTGFTGYPAGFIA